LSMPVGYHTETDMHSSKRSLHRKTCYAGGQSNIR
jgi:hypothetical protein